MMATGSFDVSGWSFALVPFVHKDNPLSSLTIEQLDGIFGARAAMAGGSATAGTRSVARGPEKNIRTWGQLGLKGEWANKPIRVLGLQRLNFHFPRDFADKVFGGGYKWNEKLDRVQQQGANRRATQTTIGKLWVAGDQMMDELGKDKYAITYTAMLYVEQAERQDRAARADRGKGPFVAPTLESGPGRGPIRWSREVYFYANRKAGEKKLDPLVAEYLRFVVSREGQALMMKPMANIFR
jgi:phosphate transport system substrate-binding protein